MRTTIAGRVLRHAESFPWHSNARPQRTRVIVVVHHPKGPSGCWPRIFDLLGTLDRREAERAGLATT